MILLLLLVEYVSSQSCSQSITLPSNSICGPKFEGAPVLFSAFEEFTKNIFQLSDASASMIQINQNGKCNISQDDVKKQQYQISFFCSLMVSDALKSQCNSASPFLPEKNKICSNICNAARRSVSKGLSTCSDSKTITSVFSFCSSGSDSSDSCFSGVTSEIESCGFRNKDAAQVGCPSLRQNEFGTECCQQLFPGIVFLPATQNDDTIPLSVGIGIAVGIAIFLILAGLLASILWCTTPKRKRPDSNFGNSLLKTDAMRDSFSTTSTDLKPLKEFQKPVDYLTKSQKAFDGYYQNAEMIGIDSPYLLNSPQVQEDQKQIPMMVQIAPSEQNYNPYRSTIDLDHLDTFDESELHQHQMQNRSTIDLDHLDTFDESELHQHQMQNRSTIDLDHLETFDESELHQHQMQNRNTIDLDHLETFDRSSLSLNQMGPEIYQQQEQNYRNTIYLNQANDGTEPYQQAIMYRNMNQNSISNRDSVVLISGTAHQSIYSNMLFEQFSEYKSDRDSGSYRAKDYGSIYSRGSKHFPHRDSEISINFPSPPNNPPRNNNFG